MKSDIKVLATKRHIKYWKGKTMGLSAVMSLYVCFNRWNQQLNYDAQKVQEWWFPIYDSNNLHSLRNVKRLITKILTLKRIHKHKCFFAFLFSLHNLIWETHISNTASVTQGKNL